MGQHLSKCAPKHMSKHMPKHVSKYMSKHIVSSHCHVHSPDWTGDTQSACACPCAIPCASSGAKCPEARPYTRLRTVRQDFLFFLWKDLGACRGPFADRVGTQRGSEGRVVVETLPNVHSPRDPAVGPFGLRRRHAPKNSSRSSVRAACDCRRAWDSVFFFVAGRKVQVKLSVKTPAFGWGEADHVSVFKVKEVDNEYAADN